MRWERIIWVVALLVVGGVGFYSGQIIGSRASAQNSAAAAQGFFNQRGGQGGQAGQGGQGGFARGGGVAGTVTSVSGSTITITTRNGQAQKIELAANGTVRKQVDGQVSDLTPGTQIVAIGAMNGDTLQANTIQIGGGFGGNRNNGGGNGGNSGGNNGGNGGNNGGQAQQAP